MKKLYLFSMFITVLSDQASKFYISSFINRSGYIEITSFVKLVEVWNTGISFGILSFLPYGAVFFSILSSLIVSILLYFMYKSSDMLTCFGFSLMVGGALGNLIDRIHYGAVYDFIYFHISNYYWPAFNLADTYIVFGMFILLYKCCIEIFLEKSNKR